MEGCFSFGPYILFRLGYDQYHTNPIGAVCLTAAYGMGLAGSGEQPEYPAGKLVTSAVQTSGNHPLTRIVSPVRAGLASIWLAAAFHAPRSRFLEPQVGVGGYSKGMGMYAPTGHRFRWHGPGGSGQGAV